LLARRDFETDAIALTLVALRAAGAALSRWGKGRLEEASEARSKFLPSKSAYKACAKTQTLVENVQGAVLIFIQAKGRCRR
jgi:hypothetical protein